MRRLSKLFVMVGAALMVAGSGPALEDGDKGEIRRVIEQQIDAFRHDDAAGAYAFAAPAIQRVMPSADEFLAMVKRSYPPVYRPRSFAFVEGRDGEAHGADQAVTIQAEDGTDWVALYSLAKQPDGAWRITGCVLVKAPGTLI